MFWEWVEDIRPGVRPRPFFAIWPRGGAKSTSAEAAVVRLGAKGVRKFCLYVRATQDNANESVQNIAAMLEREAFANEYPLMAQRKLGRYGFARGWRMDTLRCATDFSVIAFGFDAAIRGIKIEEARPDLIILDDIDQPKDTPKIVAKKIETLTTSILPAGSNDVAILGVQNLMHDKSVFTQIAEGTADFLYKRRVSGPHPAVHGLEYEAKKEGGYEITAGEPTWEGQDLAVCEQQINDWGLTAFLREAQHQLEQKGGIWNHIEFVRVAAEDVPKIARGAVWVDPAISTTDESDAMGIQADGLGEDGKLYRFFSWEQVTTPEDAIRKAILKCLQLGFNTLGIETDQGGDAWRSTFYYVWDHMEKEGALPYQARMPRLVFAKAGSGHGSKIARNQRMLTDYELGKVVHVIGTHKVLERALKRFPNKPMDVADAAYWSWHGLMSRKGDRERVNRAAMQDALTGRSRFAPVAGRRPTRRSRHGSFHRLRRR